MSAKTVLTTVQPKQHAIMPLDLSSARAVPDGQAKMAASVPILMNALHIW
jgi:hypothetical protein